MKILQYKIGNTVSHGILKNRTVFSIEGNIFADYTINEDYSYDLEKTMVLPPVYPSKIIAVGLNYRDHAEEFNQSIPDEPILFMKPPTSVIGHGDSIIYPDSSGRVDFEAEIAAVVKKRAFKIKEENAQNYILGYTCLNDVTARDLQKKDGQWTRSKSFNTFCPIGPVIETEIDPNRVNIFSRLNGEVKQSSNTMNFIFPLFQLFSFVSNIMTLLPGDVITTGTPSGVGPMKPGDIIEIEVEGIGVLQNRVISDDLLH